MTRAELLAALADAKGPNRALDWAIHCHVADRVGMYSNCPRYTASLDAALTLVPHNWALERLRQADYWFCEVRHMRSNRVEWHSASTAALAVVYPCIAARSAP